MSKKRIGEILIEEGFLRPIDLNKALEVQKNEGGSLGCLLVRMGFISDENLAVALSQKIEAPFIRLKSYRVNREAVKQVPRDVCEKFLLFSFERGEKEISVAMSNPLDEEALEVVRKGIRSKLQIFLARISEIQESINRYYPDSSQVRRKEDVRL